MSGHSTHKECLERRAYDQTTKEVRSSNSESRNEQSRIRNLLHPFPKLEQERRHSPILVLLRVGVPEQTSSLFVHFWREFWLTGDSLEEVGKHTRGFGGYGERCFCCEEGSGDTSRERLLYTERGEDRGDFSLHFSCARTKYSFLQTCGRIVSDSIHHLIHLVR